MRRKHQTIRAAPWRNVFGCSEQRDSSAGNVSNNDCGVKSLPVAAIHGEHSPKDVPFEEFLHDTLPCFRPTPVCMDERVTGSRVLRAITTYALSAATITVADRTRLPARFRCAPDQSHQFFFRANSLRRHVHLRHLAGLVRHRWLLWAWVGWWRLWI